MLATVQPLLSACSRACSRLEREAAGEGAVGRNRFRVVVASVSQVERQTTGMDDGQESRAREAALSFRLA
jgi:hypothetical protein